MDLLSFFGPGLLVRPTNHGVSLLRGHALGEIAVPSGRVRVADPWSFDAGRELEVPAGHHPVTFSALEMEAGLEGVGLCVRARQSAVVRWVRSGTVRVDGAAIALGDAQARLPAPLLEFDDPYRARRIGRSIVAAQLGDDGTYVVRSGLDARARVAAIAVVTRDPRAVVPFRGAPDLDLGSLDACLAWARAIGGADALIRPGTTDVATLRTIRRVPRELARYYRSHDAGDLDAFRAMVRRHDLGEALPVVVEDDGLVYLDRAGRIVHLYRGGVMGTYLDLRAWVVLSTIATFDLGRAVDR
ncbi:MAG: hypothetical protein U0326_44535 [Polyangiales bacterium]